MVSFDQSEDEFKEHLVEIDNWLFIPWDDSERIKALREECKVVGIPQLFIYDTQTGKLLRKNGKQEVML
jgi:hypothetical protein